MNAEWKFVIVGCHFEYGAKLRCSTPVQQQSPFWSHLVVSCPAMSSSSIAPAAAPSSDPYTPNLPDIDARVDASKHMSIRHAAAVAAASIEKKLTTTLSTCETVHLTRDLTELQRCSLQSELGFLDALQRMTNEEMLETLFTLFDSDGSGSVDKNELARNMKKLDQRSFSESLDAAILSIHAFDCDGDGCMDLDEFADFIESLVNSLECALEDLAQFLTLRVAFCDSGSAVLDEAIVTLVQDSTASVLSVEDFDDAVVEVRMMLLVRGTSENTKYIYFYIYVKGIHQK
jgi:Ca2+-binding EF-hand superfamily protein